MRCLGMGRQRYHQPRLHREAACLSSSVRLRQSSWHYPSPAGISHEEGLIQTKDRDREQVADEEKGSTKANASVMKSTERKNV